MSAERAGEALECSDNVSVVGVVAFVSDSGSFVVVHTCLDVAGLLLVPATLIRLNDWTEATVDHNGRDLTSSVRRTGAFRP